MLAINTATLKRIAVRTGLLLLTNCAAPTSREPTRASHAVDGTPTQQASNPSLVRGAQAGSSSTVLPSPGLLPQPGSGSATAGDAGTLDGCRAGTYSGTYEIGLLGGGPLQFELVASQASTQSGPACQEFCPQLTIDTEGGRFSGSWFGIEGVAKINGGLDCHTGEFRAELVDGHHAHVS